MTASFLIPECLEKIFSNLLDENLSRNIQTRISTKDLYSCTLVSRHWCRISTPFLYAYPFHRFRHLAYLDFYLDEEAISYFKLIRTLLNCIPKIEIEQIITSNNNKEISFTHTLTTFNYVTFIRGLIFDQLLFNTRKLLYYQEIWLPIYNNDNIKMEFNQFTKISIPIMNHLIKFLCKHCYNLTILEFPFTIQNNELFYNMIELLTTIKDKNERNKLNNLRNLYYIDNINRHDELPDLYLALTNNVYNLELIYHEKIDSIEKANSLSKFISLQRNLQHIILCEDELASLFYIFDDINIDYYYSIVFNSLSTQCKSLRILEFINLSFNEIDEKALISLCSLKNIKELKLYECDWINDNLCSWANNLRNLEVLEYVLNYSRIFPENFLIQLIKFSFKDLIKLVLYYKREQDQGFRLIENISLYSHSLIHLELPKIFPNELISIFKSCIKLIYLSAILSGDRSWDENFRILGKFIPKRLQKIRFKKMDHFVFSSNELKCFLEECVNSNSELKYLEISGKCNVNQEYFNVANQFEIHLI
ncbi:hypothetical protein RclHR1_00030055 [Rhizophagus clarus]|uniref:Uncharacterized protein n=1 Tax=Rhizophagus clarus TaxID=94130 RepID=A0A2Z6S072_9GLOM|nr:hypothetical protein RclHR1_00030055 [Rhizophagus clarus]GES95566.1 hypothetical protein GLOIN_2v1769492 [Rhizophagus clarus]